MSPITIEIKNKKAYYDYFVEESLECGISLRGNEVKSIRDGSCSIKESWCRIQDDNLVIRGMHITKWGTSNNYDVDEDRERQLLAHRKEINKLASKAAEDGVSLIPLKVYFKDGKCKVLVGVCRGKKNYDKRSSLKEKKVKRDINRAFKDYNK
jgi:SsrA-binding protein